MRRATTERSEVRDKRPEAEVILGKADTAFDGNAVPIECKRRWPTGVENRLGTIDVAPFLRFAECAIDGVVRPEPLDAARAEGK
jgi:hypothetical protein